MSTNHEECAKKTPGPYQGKVTKPGTAQADGQKCSVVEAANCFDSPPILARFGDWAICKDGLNCLYINYHVAKTRFHESDWIEHVTEKPWVNPKDFIKAFETAKEMAAIGKI